MAAARLVGFALIGARAAANSSPWRRTWHSPALAAATGNPDARTLNRPDCPHDGDMTSDGACLDCGLALPRRTDRQDIAASAVIARRQRAWGNESLAAYFDRRIDRKVARLARLAAIGNSSASRRAARRTVRTRTA